MINGVKAHKRIVDVPRQLLSCCHKTTCSAQTTVVWYPPPSSPPPSEWPPNLPVTSFLTEGIWWTKPSTGCQNDPPPTASSSCPSPPLSASLAYLQVVFCSQRWAGIQHCSLQQHMKHCYLEASRRGPPQRHRAVATSSSLAAVHRSASARLQTNLLLC